MFSNLLSVFRKKPPCKVTSPTCQAGVHDPIHSYTRTCCYWGNVRASLLYSCRMRVEVWKGEQFRWETFRFRCRRASCRKVPAWGPCVGQHSGSRVAIWRSAFRHRAGPGTTAHAPPCHPRDRAGSLAGVGCVSVGSACPGLVLGPHASFSTRCIVGADWRECDANSIVGDFGTGWLTSHPREGLPYVACQMHAAPLEH
jgi:hypothetical protein